MTKNVTEDQISIRGITSTSAGIMSAALTCGVLFLFANVKYGLEHIGRNGHPWWISIYRRLMESHSIFETPLPSWALLACRPLLTSFFCRDLRGLISANAIFVAGILALYSLIWILEGPSAFDWGQIVLYLLPTAIVSLAVGIVVLNLRLFLTKVIARVVKGSAEQEH